MNVTPRVTFFFGTSFKNEGEEAGDLHSLAPLALRAFGTINGGR
ncbi:hypothetical protein [Novipirellula rosea]